MPLREPTRNVNPLADDESGFAVAPVEAPVPFAQTLDSPPAPPPETLGYEDQKHIIRVKEAAPDFAFPARDLYLPIGLIVASMLSFFVSAYNRHDQAPFRTALVVAVSYCFLKLLIVAVSTPLMIRFAGVSLGMTGSAVLKLAALALAPDATATAFYELIPGCISVPAAPLIVTAVAGLLLHHLFELDVHEIVWCMIVLLLVSGTPIFLWFRVYGHLLGM